MVISQEIKTAARENLRRFTVFTLAQLMDQLSCSRRTAQRFLKKWRCHTSYNANARYYALPEVVRFDQDGIWRHGLGCFSADGNLSETMVGMIKRAPEGMTARVLSEVLRVNTNSILYEFVRSGKLFREKVGPCFVYFSDDKGVRVKQVRIRKETHSLRVSMNLTDAVIVLVEFIQNPVSDSRDLAAAVRSRAPTVSPDAIERFFVEHGLNWGKKRASRSQL